MRDEQGLRSVRIAEQIRRQIINGTLAAGTRLRGQRELAQQYETTLMTIRHALALLEAGGLIRSEHGVGTFVAESGLDPEALQLASFGETVSRPPEVRLRSIEPHKDAPEAAQLLGLTSGTPVVLLERLRLLEGTPIVYQQSFLPPSLAGIVDKFRAEASLYRQLQERFGERAVTSRETLQPVLLSAMQAALLECSAGTPAFRSCRLTLNLHNRPLVYDEALLVGGHWLMVGDRLGLQGEWGLYPRGDSHSALSMLVDSKA